MFMHRWSVLLCLMQGIGHGHAIALEHEIGYALHTAIQMIKRSHHVCTKSRFLETCDSVPCVWCLVTKLVLGRSEPHNILV